MYLIGPPIFLGQPDATLPGVVAFWTVFYAWFLIELRLGWRYRVPAGATVHDRGSRWLLVGSIGAGVALGTAAAFATAWAAFTSGRRAIFVTGLVLMVVGMALRWYAIRVLGRSFTCRVAIQPGQHVVDNGPYRWVRHPSYTGSLLTILGILLCCVNPVSLLGLVPPVAGYAYRIRIEEKALTAELGEAYRSYARQTRRLLPFLI